MKWAVLLPAALLAGGLRDPRLAALSEAAVFAAVWIERPPLGPAAPWLPWLAWALLSALLGSQPLAALPLLARWSAALAVASLAAGWNERGREQWLKSLLACATVLAAAALATGFKHGSAVEMTGLIPPYYNYTAFALAAAAAAAGAWALHPRTERSPARLAGLGAAALGAACILLAHSRGAALGLAVGFSAWSIRRWKWKAAAPILCAVFAAGAAFRADLFPAPMRAAVLKSQRQLGEARPRIWRAAAVIATEKPWLGVGPGSFGPAFRAHLVEAAGLVRWGMSTDYAHSEPLQTAAETGWAGLALWLFGLGVCLRGLARGADAEPAREAAAVAAAAMLPQLAMDNMLQLPGLAFLFFTATAVAGSYRGGKRRWPRVAAVAAAALALTAWIPRALAQNDPARAAALFPAEDGAFEDLAYRAMGTGSLTEADRLWAQAALRAPFNAVYPWRRAQIAAARGQWTSVEALSKVAVTLEPGFLNARLLRVEALARLERPDEARAELAQALYWKLKPRDNPAPSGYYAAVSAVDENEFARMESLVERP